MSGVAIVALPREGEKIYKISTEKVPHMTLLYLGDSSKIENLQSIIDLVGHAASMSDPFWMRVNKREVLDQQADVYTFVKSYNSTPAMFRSQLLQNESVRKAFDAVFQYDAWTPHITLGYPASPAREDEMDYPIYGMEFDRVAVWTGEYEGPIFELGSKDGEQLSEPDVMHADEQTIREFFDSGSRPKQDNFNTIVAAKVDEDDISGMDDLVQAYEDIDDNSKSRIEVKHSDIVDDILAHYGVKGMQWGVRRTAAQLGNATKKLGAATKKEVARDEDGQGGWHLGASPDAKRVADLRKLAVHRMSDAEINLLVNRMNLEKRLSDARVEVARSEAARKQKGAGRISKMRKYATDLGVEIAKNEISRVAKAQTKMKVDKQMIKKNPALAEYLKGNSKKKK